MILTVSVVLAVCGLVRSSGVPVLPAGAAPVVTAASSQYFERTFNRLVVPPVVQPVYPVAPTPSVVIQPAIQPIQPSVPAVVPVAPPPNAPVEPNIAIAIATAHAAAPVATFLLPPYPFGPPPAVGFVPPQPPINVPDDTKESTTQTTTTVQQVTTQREPETTTQIPASSDNNFVQALPSNQNTNFRPFYGPPPVPVPQPRPQKLKTSVEVVPVPLTYIAPPPLIKHQPIKAIKHIHTFVPTKAKIIIRPVSAPLRIRTVRVPAKIITYRVPVSARKLGPRYPQRIVGNPKRDPEPTTFSPFARPSTKPPRV